MKIDSTKLSNSVTDTNYIKFINIVNDVFPLDIEEGYVNLTNIIIDYINNSSKLIRYDNLLFNLDKEIFNNDKEKQLLINEKNNLINILNKNYKTLPLISESSINFSSDLWKNNKINIEEKIIKYDDRINYLDNKIKINLEERKKYSLVIKNIKDELLFIIKNISNNIKDLKDIDTSNILGKHINNIRQLDLNKEEIKLLEETLINYCRIRILSFNIIKDLSIMILSSYNNNHSFLNINDKKYNIIINSLINFNITKEDNIKDLIYAPLFKTNLYLTKITIDYLKNNNVDLDSINEKNEYILYTPDTDLTKEIIKDLNTINKESRKRK